MADGISQPREVVPAGSTMRCSSADIFLSRRLSSFRSFVVGHQGGGVHAAELGAPLVECGAANSVFTVQSRYAGGRVGLLEGRRVARIWLSLNRDIDSLHAGHPRAHGENPTPDGCGFQGGDYPESYLYLSDYLL